MKTNYSKEELKFRHKFSKIKSGILYRTTNPNCPRYKDYGGKGIHLCKDWHNLDKFIADGVMLKGFDRELFMQGKIALDKDIFTKGLSKEYNKNNCQWVSLSDNNKVKPNQQKPFKVFDSSANRDMGIFYNQSEVSRLLKTYPASISNALRKTGHYKNYWIFWI